MSPLSLSSARLSPYLPAQRLLMPRAATNSQSKGSLGHPETFTLLMVWPLQLMGELSAPVSPGHSPGKGSGRFTHLFH